MRAPHRHAVPAHVRNLQRARYELHGFGIQPAETFRRPFRAAAREQLHPEAEAEDRHAVAGDTPVERLVETTLHQGAHAVVERADALEDQRRRGTHALRRRGHAALYADTLQHVHDGADVPHAVIDDRDHRAISSATSRLSDAAAPAE